MATTPTATPGQEPSEGLENQEISPEPTETPTEGTGEGEIESTQPSGEGTETQPEGQESGEGDGRLIPHAIRSLKESNPEAYKVAKASVISDKTYRGIFPTHQEARDTKQLIQSVGGKQGLATMREDLSSFSDVARQFLSGSPDFVNDLWEQDKVAAAQHVQPMMDALKTHDPEGYKGLVTRFWDNELQAIGMRSAITNLVSAIERAKAGDKAAFDDALWILRDAKQGNQGASILNWLTSIEESARRQEDPRVKSLLAERNQQREGAAKAQKEEFLKGYRTEATNTVVREGSRIFDSFFKNAKISKDDRNDLLREAMFIANKEVKADQAFIEQRDGHLSNSDNASAVELTKSRFNKAMVEAVKRVARRYSLISGKPAQQQGQGNNNQGKGQGKGTTVPAGWVQINARPEPTQIDRSRTSPSDILAGRAILKDGRKVSWEHLKKKAS